MNGRANAAQYLMLQQVRHRVVLPSLGQQQQGDHDFVKIDFEDCSWPKPDPPASLSPVPAIAPGVGMVASPSPSQPAPGPQSPTRPAPPPRPKRPST